MLLLAVLLPAGFGVAQIASSAPPTGFCAKKPLHPKCVRTTGSTGSTTVPTTAPPPTTTVTTTVPPPTTTVPTQTGVANIWIAPPTT